MQGNQYSPSMDTGGLKETMEGRAAEAGFCWIIRVATGV